MTVVASSLQTAMLAAANPPPASLVDPVGNHWATLVPMAIVLGAMLLRSAVSTIDRLAAECGGDRPIAVERAIAGIYLRALHRARFEGFDEIERNHGTLLREGPLLVVANHTCGLDPVLLQMPIPRRIRWMMWTGQMGVGLGWLWRHLQVLPVAQDGRDLASVRNALRSLREGDVIGIFPEGGIERPPGVLKPFEPGLGVLAARSQAPVLLCLVTGTPAPRVFGSFIRPSRSSVRAIGVFRPEKHESGERFLERLSEAMQAEGGGPTASPIAPEA